MTAAEARQRAAQIVLYAITDRHLADQPTEVLIELRLIEAWLRRRAVGSDKILTRQMERPTGGKVGMSPKQARRLGIPSVGKDVSRQDAKK